VSPASGGAESVLAGGPGVEAAARESGVEAAAGGPGVEAAGERDRRIDDVRAALSELLGAERRLRGRDQHHRQGGLTYAQLRALMVLRDGERTAGALAEAANCNPASTTAMLDHLEAAGVIERRRDTRDRRVCLVALTEEGRRLVEEKRASSQKIWQTRFGGASGTDLQAAAQAMRTIAEMLDAH
jgi:DNA-binding MarR family transcriptional regulator